MSLFDKLIYGRLVRDANQLNPTFFIRDNFVKIGLFSGFKIVFINFRNNELCHYSLKNMLSCLINDHVL